MKSTPEMIAGIITDRNRLIEIKQEAVLLERSIPIAIRGVVSNIEKGKGSGDLIKDLVIINHTMFDAPELEEKYRSLQGRLEGNLGQCIFVKEKKDYRPFAGYPHRTISRERISLGVLNGESFVSGFDGFAYTYFLPVNRFISYWRDCTKYPREKFCGHEKMHVPLFQETEKGIDNPIIWIGDKEIDEYLNIAPDDELLFFMEAGHELGVNFKSVRLKDFSLTKTKEFLKDIEFFETMISLINVGAEFKNEDLGSVKKKMENVLLEAARLGIIVPIATN